MKFIEALIDRFMNEDFGMFDGFLMFPSSVFVKLADEIKDALIEILNQRLLSNTTDDNDNNNNSEYSTNKISIHSLVRRFFALLPIDDFIRDEYRRSNSINTFNQLFDRYVQIFGILMKKNFKDVYPNLIDEFYQTFEVLNNISRRHIIITSLLSPSGV